MESEVGDSIVFFFKQKTADEMRTRDGGSDVCSSDLVQVLRTRCTTVCDRETIATTTPRETLSRVVAVLERWHAPAPIAAIGIGSFGPIRLDRRAPDFGVILPPPTPGPAGADIFGPLTAPFHCPALIYTDLTGAPLAELRRGPGAGGEGPA